jgi:penicillin amidase
MHRVICTATLVLVALSTTPAGTNHQAASQGDGMLQRARGRLSQTSGTIAVPGLKADVRVVRDQWGVPHIYAKNQDDLFFAQGFVQAQDRLFQMDLWRRSTQGSLAELLGPDYVERDRMSRLLRYRGDMQAEWTSYAPDGQQIVTQFVRGINAWVEIARANPPLEFDLAGYAPATWQPEDVLSRAEAFVMSSNATAEVFRARLTAAVGPDRAAQLLPPDPPTAIDVPKGLDLALFDRSLADTLGRIGTGASGFGPALRLQTTSGDPHVEGSNNWVVSGARSVTGRPLLANDPHRALDHPSLRYIVHLNAPGWNVIGANQPWLPGVSFGHNDRIAWGATLFQADAQDLYVEKLNPANPRQYEHRGKWIDMRIERESIPVRGRSPAVVELAFTRNGPVIATDAARHAAFVLRWTGAEPGTAGYLANIGMGRARTSTEFRQSLARWKMPGENIIYADIDGNIGFQAAALAPIRKRGSGLLPVPGWTDEYAWDGWYTLDDLPHEVNPKAGYIATANHNTLPPGEKRVINYAWSDPARINRIREVLSARPKFGVDDFQALQHDSVAWTASQLVPLLRGVTASDPSVERGRNALLEWDRNVSKASGAAALFVMWEQKLADEIGRDRVPGPIGTEFAGRARSLVLPVLTKPTATWFGENPSAGRDRALTAALAAAVTDLQKTLGPDLSKWQWGALHSATFRHALASSAETTTLLNVGPFPRAGYGLTPFATGGRGFEQNSGSSYRHIIDVADWDRSVATSAPGQSGQPGSAHFDDLAKLWAEHKYFPLPFSDRAVQANAKATLALTPLTPRP